MAVPEGLRLTLLTLKMEDRGHGPRSVGGLSKVAKVRKEILPQSSPAHTSVSGVWGPLCARGDGNQSLQRAPRTSAEQGASHAVPHRTFRKTLRGRGYYCLHHVTEEETEAQRVCITCQGSQSWDLWSLGFRPFGSSPVPVLCAHKGHFLSPM